MDDVTPNFSLYSRLRGLQWQSMFMAQYFAMSQQGEPEQASLLLYKHRASESALPPLPPCGMRLCYCTMLIAYAHTHIRVRVRARERTKKERTKERNLWLCRAMQIVSGYQARAMQIVSGYQAKELITARPYEYIPTSLNRHANDERGSLFIQWQKYPQIHLALSLLIRHILGVWFFPHLKIIRNKGKCSILEI